MINGFAVSFFVVIQALVIGGTAVSLRALRRQLTVSNTRVPSCSDCAKYQREPLHLEVVFEKAWALRKYVMSLAIQLACRRHSYIE